MSGFEISQQNFISMWQNSVDSFKNSMQTYEKFSANTMIELFEQMKLHQQIELNPTKLYQQKTNKKRKVTLQR
jgi:hypothetical protein